MTSQLTCRRCLLFLRRTFFPSGQLQPWVSQPSHLRPLSYSVIRPGPKLDPNPPPLSKSANGPVSEPKSELPSGDLDYRVPPNAPTTMKIANEVRKRAAGVTETYIAYGATEKLYRQCAAQADYSVPQAKERDTEIPKTPDGFEMGVGRGWWYQNLQLVPTFNTWAQVTMLHLYFFVTRFRCFPTAHAPAWQQHLVDHFFHDAERHMIVDHRMATGMARSRYLKDMYVQYRGILAAYDEGLCKNDAVLATALWRNLFAANDDVNLHSLACVVAYVRNTVRAMDLISDESISTGMVHFIDPVRTEPLVRLRSKLLDQPFVSDLPPQPATPSPIDR